MKFPLTQELIDEAKRFHLKTACHDCFYWMPARTVCAHDWPDEGQRRELDEPNADGTLPAFAAFCKEFELR